MSHIKLNLVEGKAEAPWIRRMQGKTVQFTNFVEEVDVSLKSSAPSSLLWNILLKNMNSLFNLMIILKYLFNNIVKLNIINEKNN